jgi:Ca2+-binding EF-hand superfamily protein
MMKKHLLTALALMTVSGFAWAGSGKVSFQDLDTNRDGQISLEEAKKAPEISKKFVQADTNQDGKLDAAEFAALEAMPKETK